MARAGAKVRQGARKPRTGRFHGKEERTPIIRSDPVPADWFPRRGSICQLCRSGSLCGSRPQPAGSSLRAHVQPLRQRDPGVQPHRIEAQSGGQHQTADHQPVTPCARKPYCCMHVGVLLWPEPRWHCRTREGRAGAAPAAAFGPVVAKGGQHAHEKSPSQARGKQPPGGGPRLQRLPVGIGVVPGRTRRDSFRAGCADDFHHGKRIESGQMTGHGAPPSEEADQQAQQQGAQRQAGAQRLEAVQFGAGVVFVAAGVHE